MVVATADRNLIAYNLQNPQQTIGFQNLKDGEGGHVLAPQENVQMVYQVEKDSGDGKQSTADMTQFVQTLLQQMQNRFQTMSDSIVSKIDEMGERISELEQSINDLRAEMGAEGTPPPAVPKKEEGSA
ncbi:hypothetical protein CTI12_AA530790 [Artemisia annua]|uniref:Heat shock factor binding protein n=1 Tax=Artemisia annua TaxID=35608 RepID=A0A2U1L4L6_ARTAN|nr:hypothetical protein CTI12_AA530790 [Artemisia annua]